MNCYHSVNERFWNLLAPYCTVHTAVRKMPFVTSTCRGCGKTASIDGKVIIFICGIAETSRIALQSH